MENYCKYNLDELSVLILKMDQEQYTRQLTTLTQATIGQHVRHIVEFYVSLNTGIKKGVVSYDKRKRDLRLENDVLFTSDTIEEIKSNLLIGNTDIPLLLEGDFAQFGNKTTQINTSYYRELAYCLEHSIHHQALIKVGLIELEIDNLIDEYFGVAPATIRFRMEKIPD